MQLVLSNNRVIAHGENFIAMGGVVINTETGARYENATVAECAGCPSDIDSVGYEYHAGQFVPCAPFGMGNNNGYFMEVCTDCATPRNSGIPIQDYKNMYNDTIWETLAEATVNLSALNENKSVTVPFAVDMETLAEFSEIAIVAKSGLYINNSDNYAAKVLINQLPILQSNNNGYMGFTEDLLLYQGNIHPYHGVDRYTEQRSILLNGVTGLNLVCTTYHGAIQGTFELKARNKNVHIID